jgi:hypothetical protein
MARIWCCQAMVTVKEPMNVPGYSGTQFSVPVKVRTESEREPSGDSIIAQARELMGRCYSAEVLNVNNPITNFLLW